MELFLSYSYLGTISHEKCAAEKKAFFACPLYLHISMKSIRCALFPLPRRDLSLSLAENSGVRINRRFKIALSLFLRNTVVHGNVTHGDEQMDRVTV